MAGTTSLQVERGGAWDGGIDDGGGCRPRIVCEAAIWRAPTRDQRMGWWKGLFGLRLEDSVRFGSSIKESGSRENVSWGGGNSSRRSRYSNRPKKRPGNFWGWMDGKNAALVFPFFSSLLALLCQEDGQARLVNTSLVR